MDREPQRSKDRDPERGLRHLLHFGELLPKLGFSSSSPQTWVSGTQGGKKALPPGSPLSFLVCRGSTWVTSSLRPYSPILR